MNGRLAIGFLMDRYERLNLATETSLLLMQELMSRGHRVYWVEQPGISVGNHGVMAKLSEVQSVEPFVLGRANTDVTSLEAFVIRKDPPFDESYLHLTYLLDFLPADIIQINSPAALRDINEKLYTLNWPEYCPDTLVSMDVGTLIDFVNRHKKVVLKPLDDCSGRGIEFIEWGAAKLERNIRSAVGRHGYVMLQRFLPEIRRGDKRVYLAAGQPVGWVDRIPAPGKDLANIHQGASCRVTELSHRERNISEIVGKTLLERGILLAGLDFIDERLTEINVTSPSAVRQINEVTGAHLERTIVDAMVDYIRQRQSALRCTPGGAVNDAIRPAMF